jgi:DNA-binding NtrC family response regulator
MRAPGREVAETRENPLAAAPLRVLLVSRDRRFRSVAATLLERRGMSVAIGQPTGRLAELARRERAEVVVLDAGRGLTDAAHEAAEIEALLPKVGVVVVGEQSASGLSSMPVLAKWGLFDGLFSAIELARPNRDGAYADVS